MERNDDLDGEDNVKYNAPQDVINFVLHAPGMQIDSKDVKDVKGDQFEAMQQQFEANISQLEQNNDLLQQKMRSNEVEFKEAIGRATAAAEDANRRAQDAEDRAKDASANTGGGFFGAIGKLLDSIF